MEPGSPLGASSRTDHITLARKKFGAAVILSGLGPGNERVVAAEYLLLDAAGIEAVMDVTRATVAMPSLGRAPSQLEEAAWAVVTSYRALWIEAWERAEELRGVEARERSRIYNLAHASRRKAARQELVRAAAWEMIEPVEASVRRRLLEEEELVIGGLMSFFRSRRNEIDIRQNMR